MTAHRSSVVLITLAAAALLASPAFLLPPAPRLHPLRRPHRAHRLEGLQASAAPQVIDVDAAPTHNHDLPIDVLVVGAGAAGIGVAIMLTRIFRLDKSRVVLVERGGAVGESFLRWPREMRFISPSFNQQGWTGSFDLNAVHWGTSPALALHSEHPTGEEYADYLRLLAEECGLNVMTHRDVVALRPLGDGGFEVETAPARPGPPPEVLRSRYVIWAAGEFQYPRMGAALFPGAEHCLHNSSVRSWAELPGDDFVVIGGYESGVDAAANLSSLGRRCSVVASTDCWNAAAMDPSLELAPHTAQRLKAALASSSPPRLLAPLRVFAVEEEEGSGGYLVRARRVKVKEHGRGALRAEMPEADASGEAEVVLRTPQKPLLCTGFVGGVRLGAARELFDWGQRGEAGCAEGSPLLSKVDESTKTPGLFLVGPAVRHKDLSFCFVYKFRQRLGVVADAIAQGLGYNTAEAVRTARQQEMFMDEDGLSCCREGCGEAC